MIHGYPYTDFHELNLDYILKLCRETMGLHFDQADKFLKLVNQAGEEVSKIKLYYAETALKDDDGNVISTYIIDAGVDGNNIVFDRGNGEIITLTIPYATKAKTDVNNVDITSYVHGVGVSGNKVLITFGDGTNYSFTVPFATKASGDENGKNITTYVAELSTANDKLIVTDGAGVTLAEITIPYAVKALNDVDGDAIKSTYATDLTVDTTTVQLRSKDDTVLSTITVPYAVKALTDTAGNTFLGDYAYNLAVNGNKIAVEAHNGTTLNEITVPFATLSTDATNAIESISISGDEIVFTTHGGTSFRITAPYAVKAQKDSLNNTISHSYVASVTNDPATGEMNFYASDGTLLATLTPTVDEAVHDSYANLIADYVKEIIVNPQNNYVVVNHGTGDSDTLTINYSTHAYKDTYDNVIGNTYIRSLSIIIDPDDDTKYLVAYNGELSELFRIDLGDFEPEFGLVDTVVIEYQNSNIVQIHWYNKATTITVNDLLYYMEAGYPVMIYDRVSHTRSFINYMSETTSTPLYITGIFFNADDAYTVTIDLTNMTISINPLTVPTELNDLTDVSLNGQLNSEVLKYNGTSQKWENSFVTLNNIYGVDANNPANGEVLSYDSNTSKWKNTTLPQVITNNIRDEQINVNVSINAGASQAVSLTLSGNFAHRPLIFTPMLSSNFTSNISIEYVRLALFSSSSMTINVQLKNNSSNAQTVQGIIYLSLFTR